MLYLFTWSSCTDHQCTHTFHYIVSVIYRVYNNNSQVAVLPVIYHSSIQVTDVITVNYTQQLQGAYNAAISR